MGTFVLHSVKRWSYNPSQEATAYDLAAVSCEAVVCDAKGVISLFDKTGEELWRTRIPSSAFSLAISDSAKYIAAICMDKKLRLLDEDGRLMWEDTLEIGMTALDINQYDGFVVVGSSRKMLKIYTMSGKLMQSRKTELPIFDLKFAHSINGIITLSTSGDISFYNYLLEEIWTIETDKYCKSLDVSHDGELIVVTTENGELFAYNLYGDFVGQYDVMAEISAATINSSGKLLYIADYQNRLILLNRNAEVIWDKEMAARVISLRVDSSGAVCLVFSEGGDVQYLELVAEESSKTNFLEFEGERKTQEPKLLWKKDYKLVIADRNRIETILSPGGTYIIVLSGSVLSAYRENSLLLWKYNIDANDSEIIYMEDEPFFFVNSKKYLYRFNYRTGLEWKNHLNFQQIVSPSRRGNLMARDENLLFSIDKSGEIHWKRELNFVPELVSVSENGNLFAVYARGKGINIFNATGGDSLSRETDLVLKDLQFFSGNLAYLDSDNITHFISIPRMELSHYKSADEIMRLQSFYDRLLLFHKFGGLTILDKTLHKEHLFVNDVGKLSVSSDTLKDPRYIKVNKNVMIIYDKFGKEITKIKSQKIINPDTIFEKNGRLVFFAGLEMYYFATYGDIDRRKAVKYLEFN